MDGPTFERFLREHAAAVRALAISVLSNAADADDVAQETALAALQHQAELSADLNPKAWLLRIALNKARDFIRRRRVRAASSAGLDAAPAPPSPDPDVEAARRIIRSMPPRYRAALHLAYYEELPYRDIAAAMGLSLSGVKMMILRGRRMIRAAMKRNEPHEVR
jgi:RNA polymerase sigma-70 factor (ECF subfamily)